ncbi:MAG: alkaline phosphatase family protein [Proteobacteria bacterium]|nr:MAG: alkaline phosphatase family protein [Pseudomonadota bacterium]
MRYPLLSLFSSIFFAALLLSCQTPGSISRDYQRALETNHELQNDDQTTLLILVDGLSSATLSTSLKNSNAPNLKSFFRLSKAGDVSFQLARSSFPSLTYPNLTSILTASKVSEHGITGNRILVDGKTVNFENVLAWRTLDQLVEDHTVFHELTKQNKTSISYSYPFPRETTAHVEKTLQAGADYLDQRYTEIDTASITSLKRLLSETSSQQWPRFIFLHLIGVDALEHQYGPENERVQTYMKSLDEQLGEVFEIVAAGSADHETRTLLTADHGFQRIDKGLDLTSIISKLGSEIRLVQDNRVASLYFPTAMPLAKRKEIAEGLLQIPELQATVLRMGKELRVYARSDKALTTDEDLLWPALEDFFKAPNAPDLLLLPKANIDFSGAYAGNHGGFTSEEMLVPILSRGFKLPDTVFSTSDLLRLLKLMP